MLRCLPHMTNCQVPEVTPEAQAKVATISPSIL